MFVCVFKPQVVGSREWPLISKYRACVRTQYRKVEIIDNLFKPVTNEKGILVDEGIFWFDFLDYSLCCVHIVCGIIFYAFFQGALVRLLLKLREEET